MQPFLVLGLPRCRTAWLAEFLSMPGRRCLHEPSKTYTGIEDLEAALADDRAAIADSALTLRWRDILRLRPAARIVVMHRPLRDILRSLDTIGLRLPGTERVLDILERERMALLAHGGVMSVAFEALEREEVCADIFRWCHHAEMPRRRWLQWGGVRVQANVPEMLAIIAGNRAGIAATFPELGEGGSR